MRITLLAATLAVVLAAPMAGAGAADLPPGHPPMDQATTTAAKPTHSGVVLEAIPAAGYIYLHVKGSDGEEWLAGPAADLKPGTKIRWNEGMVMRNFTSKTLKRTFATIRFVEVVEPAE